MLKIVMQKKTYRRRSERTLLEIFSAIPEVSVVREFDEEMSPKSIAIKATNKTTRPPTLYIFCAILKSEMEWRISYCDVSSLLR